jgi:S1-C subfamily serine protease
MTMSAALMTATFASSATAEELAPQTMVAERTNPAMHLVTVDYSATARMKTTDWSGDGLRLWNQGYSAYASGAITFDQMVGVVFDFAAKDAERYFKGFGKVMTKKYRSGASGSGFVVNGDGYVATARHVVTDDGEFRRDFARVARADFAAEETESWRKYISAEYKVKLSDETIKTIQKAMSGYTAAKVKVSVSAPKVSVVIGMASADGSRTGKAQPAEVVYRSEPELGGDIALLRIRGKTAMPTVSLASEPLPQGETVYINCFPALPDRSEAARLTPTMTDGRITSVKPNEGGIEEMQTDANASPGCSGGAGLNKEGNVVGVLVSGAVSGTGESLGQFYLMPIDVVTEALQTRNIPAAVSLTTQLYDQALIDYSKDWYSAALGKFREVKSLYPSHPYVDRYISKCQAAISQGKDQTPVEDPPLRVGLVAGIGGGAAALLVIGTLVFLLRKRRSSPTDAGPADPTTGGDGPTNTLSDGEASWIPVEDWAKANDPDPSNPQDEMDTDSSTNAAGIAMSAKSPSNGFGDGPEDGDMPEAADQDADEFPADSDEWAPIGYVPAVPKNAVGATNRTE